MSIKKFINKWKEAFIVLYILFLFCGMNGKKLDPFVSIYILCIINIKEERICFDVVYWIKENCAWENLPSI